MCHPFIKYLIRMYADEHVLQVPVPSLTAYRCQHKNGITEEHTMSYEEVKNAAVVPVVHDNKQPCRRVSVGGREQACPTALREVGAN